MKPYEEMANLRVSVYHYKNLAGYWENLYIKLEAENVRLEELAQGRRELLDYDDKRILELSTENKELKEQCARLQQEYIRMFNQLYKED